MAVWVEIVEKQQGQEENNTLKLIGETRRFEKCNATTVVECFDDHTANTFVNLVISDILFRQIWFYGKANILPQSVNKLETIFAVFT